MKKTLFLSLMLVAAVSYAQTSKNGNFHLNQAYKMASEHDSLIVPVAAIL